MVPSAFLLSLVRVRMAGQDHGTHDGDQYQNRGHFKGQQKIVEQEPANHLRRAGIAPTATACLPLRSIKTHPISTLPISIPGIPNSIATRLPLVALLPPHSEA